MSQGVKMNQRLNHDAPISNKEINNILITKCLLGIIRRNLSMELEILSKRLFRSSKLCDPDITRV